MSLITIENFSYRYPVSSTYALKNINLKIEKGKLYALIGKNDSGKTTLCNAIRGFIPHFYRGDFTGSIKIRDKKIENFKLSDIAPIIGYLFQNPFTQITGFKDTVVEEIAYGLENLGEDRSEIQRKVDKVINQLNINELRKENPFELSGGQKQKVALASTIVMDPDIYILDEPTSQLDPQATEEVFEIIYKLKKQGKTIILVEHKIDLIAEYADKAILMDDGKVELHGEIDEVLTNEKVLKKGVALPRYAMLGLEMGKKGMPLQKIPLSERDAVNTFSDFLKGESK